MTTPTAASIHDAVGVLRPALAMPPNLVRQEEVLAVLGDHFRHVPHLERGLALMRNTSVQTRHLLVPAEQLVEAASFGERNARYGKEVVRLGVQAATTALDQSGVEARDIDFLVFVSCTGYLLPGPEAYIAQEIGCRPTVRRAPIQQLGCAAGVTALATARNHVLAFPDDQVLVVAVELPSLSFQPHLSSLSDFISAALFSDGAAAAVVRRSATDTGFQITDAVQHLLPGSTDVIYGDTSEIGFHFATNPKVRGAVPQIVPTLEELLARQGLQSSDLDFCVSHTGGPLVMTAVQEGLGLPPSALEPSRASLREIGNPSSVSIFDVLRRHHDDPPADGSNGLMLAFGPGFTTEALTGFWRDHQGTGDEETGHEDTGHEDTGDEDTGDDGTGDEEALQPGAPPASRGPRVSWGRSGQAVRPGCPGRASVASALTRRESQVASLVALGLTNRQISRHLSIAEWTAINHVRNVMRKLGLSSRVEVARWLMLSGGESGRLQGTAVPAEPAVS